MLMTMHLCGALVCSCLLLCAVCAFFDCLYVCAFLCFCLFLWAVSCVFLCAFLCVSFSFFVGLLVRLLCMFICLVYVCVCLWRFFAHLCLLCVFV